MGLHDVDLGAWQAMLSVKDWWVGGIHKRGASRKAIATLAMLVSWKIWKERKVCVFHNHYSTSMMLVSKIKEEAGMWCLAGAKALCNVMPRG
jgi:hypothetical protein